MSESDHNRILVAMFAVLLIMHGFGAWQNYVGFTTAVGRVTEWCKRSKGFVVNDNSEIPGVYFCQFIPTGRKPI